MFQFTLHYLFAYQPASNREVAYSENALILLIKPDFCCYYTIKLEICLG